MNYLTARNLFLKTLPADYPKEDAIAVFDQTVVARMAKMMDAWAAAGA